MGQNMGIMGIMGIMGNMGHLDSLIECRLVTGDLIFDFSPSLFSPHYAELTGGIFFLYLKVELPRLLALQLIPR